MTPRSWPSPRTRRALRHALWRHRRSIRAGLVGVSVLSAVQAVSARAAPTDNVETHSVVAQQQEGTSGAHDGLVRTLLRVADPSSDLLVSPGSIVDVLAAPADVGGVGDIGGVGDVPGALASSAPPSSSELADVVASGVRVVTVPGHEQVGLSSSEGAVLVVAVTPTTARVLAAAASRRLSVVVRDDGPAP